MRWREQRTSYGSRCNLDLHDHTAVGQTSGLDRLGRRCGHPCVDQALPGWRGAAVTRRAPRSANVAQTPGQVPGFGRSILVEPPTGTPGNVAMTMKSVEPVLTAFTTSLGRSVNDCPWV